jgi:hypothetical protein
LAEEEEVVLIEPARLSHLLDLLDEAVDLPELGLIGLVAVVGPSWS